MKTLEYIKEWQEALQLEIRYLKKYGSTKFFLSNGHLISSDNSYSYFFQTNNAVRIPIGSAIKLEWGTMKQEGRILSSDGMNLILRLETYIGDIISEAYLIHDPWELLDELIQRLDEIKKSKRKRWRIKNLMDPPKTTKHPMDIIKNPVHELILRSKYNPVTFVWGPPGTGKTYTLARVAANKYFKDKRVLILSHSNQAVDVLINEIASFTLKKKRFSEGDILRYGAITSNESYDKEALTITQLIKKRNPDLAEEREQLIQERDSIKKDIDTFSSKRDYNQLLDMETKMVKLLERIRQVEMKYIKDAYIVGTTLAKAAIDATIYEREFDVVILDEASMAYVPQAAFAASLGKRVIICGDFKQLPPIASSRHSLVDQWLKDDVFHQSGVACMVKEGKWHPQLFLLKEQRRMHPDISAFTNKYIYDSLVGDHESMYSLRKKIAESLPFSNSASVLLDTSYTGEYCLSEKVSNSRMNLLHLFLSFQVIHEAYCNKINSIGYVTPFRAQAFLMETMLNDLYKQELAHADIIAATVHRFQGSERDVMVFDTVDSYPLDRASMLLTGKESERLINVAITRTKGKFVHISNSMFVKKTVYKNKTIRQLVEHQEREQQNILTKDIGSWIKNQHSRLTWMNARKLEAVFFDIENAKSSIIVSLPESMSLSPQWENILVKRNKKVTLSVISTKLHMEIRPDNWIQNTITFPFICIDKRVFWLGFPFEESLKVRPPYIVARLDSTAVTKQILSQLPVENDRF